MELSDITTFAELPDGKVISSTDVGALLMWEGNFIKFRVMRNSGHACHEGEVSHCSYFTFSRKQMIQPCVGHVLNSVGKDAIHCDRRTGRLGSLLGYASYDGC